MTASHSKIMHLFPHYYRGIDVVVLITRNNIPDSVSAWGQVFKPNITPVLWIALLIPMLFCSLM